jgi:hypothetical protein
MHAMMSLFLSHRFRRDVKHVGRPRGYPEHRHQKILSPAPLPELSLSPVGIAIIIKIIIFCISRHVPPNDILYHHLYVLQTEGKAHPAAEGPQDAGTHC